MTLLNQASELIKKSQNILIIPQKEIEGDGLGASLALFHTLKKINKNVNLLLTEIPQKFQFLVPEETLVPKGPFLSPLSKTKEKEFVVSVNTLEKEVKEMRYEKNNEDLKIYLTLNSGEIKEGDISFLPVSSEQALKQENNLLITIGIESLEDLRETCEGSSRFIYETPILNIDNQVANQCFGEINLMEIKSCSLSEIIADLIKYSDWLTLDKDAATFLLAGLIFSSQNFRHSRTNPRTFETASLLIEKGAEHQKIIQHFYKTSSAPQLRLLGEILKKLNFDKKRLLYSANLTNEDFQNSGTDSKSLGFVVEKLKLALGIGPFSRSFSSLLILWQSHASPPLVKGIFYSPQPNLVKKLSENSESVSKEKGVLFIVREKNPESAYKKILKILD